MTYADSADHVHVITGIIAFVSCYNCWDLLKKETVNVVCMLHLWPDCLRSHGPNFSYVGEVISIKMTHA